ncbi:MAG: TonB C-terminal domain-containing protein [Desulfovibrio sp.]|nr:TonB C-terminal domain-containing protein [Desulfovibrio sp.]
MPVYTQARLALRRMSVGLILVIMTCFLYSQGHAATIVGASLDGKYAAKVVAAVIDAWTPPPALKNDFTVCVQMTIDENGRVAACNILSSSGLEAFDTAACGAVKKSGPFGTPPYAQPVDIYMTFWNGVPKGRETGMLLDSDAAMRAEILSRTRANAARGEQHATAVENLARLRAEAAARDSGKDLPTIRPKSPPIPPAKPKPASAPRRLRPTFATEDAQHAQASQHIGSTQKPAPKPINASPKVQGTKPVTASSSERTAAQGQKGDALTAYRNEAEARLRKVVVIPAQTAPGSYTARLRLHMAPNGTIARFSTLSSSGNIYLDKAIRSGIRRLGRLPPPPEAAKGIVDIALTLTRH